MEIYSDKDIATLAKAVEILILHTVGDCDVLCEIKNIISKYDECNVADSKNCSDCYWYAEGVCGTFCYLEHECIYKDRPACEDFKEK